MVEMNALQHSPPHCIFPCPIIFGLILLAALPESIGQVNALVCYNTCIATLGRLISFANGTYAHNIMASNATSACRPSCQGKFCFTQYSPLVSTPIYGCSDKNLSFPGCIRENETAIVCYCFSNNCNMPLTKLIKEGWSFPELVLTLPLNELLKKTIIPEVPTTTTTTRAAATASAIPPVIPTSNAILPDKNSSANTDSTSGTNSSAIGGDKQFDGVNLNSLMWPLLIPQPMDQTYNNKSSSNNGSIANEQLIFPLVIVKPPDPLYEDERKVATITQQKEKPNI